MRATLLSPSSPRQSSKRSSRGCESFRSSRGARRARDSSSTDCARMESKMIFDEARDEKVAVVVTRLQAKIQGDTTSPAGFFQQLGLELALQKLVGRALIDQRSRPFP